MTAIATVLLADDDVELRRTTRLLLESQGYRVLEAENGKEALRRIHEDTPDVALIDMVMPKATGQEVLAGVRDNWNGAPPIIMMTGYASVETVVELMRLGAADCLAKPFDEADLLKKIARALGLQSFGTEGNPAEKPVRLSRREIDVLLLMREGLTAKQIADRMGLGLRTIEEYTRRLCRKLGVSNRTGAVAWSFRHTLLPPTGGKQEPS